MKRTALKPGKPLARTISFGPRKAPLATQSPRQRQQVAAQRKAYAAAPDANQEYCVACGRPGATDHSHLLTQGGHKEHRNNHLNWIRLCRQCHELYEHQKEAFATRFPHAWALILIKLEALDPRAYEQFKLKNNL